MFRWIRIAITVAAFGYIGWRIRDQLDTFVEAFASLSVLSALLALCLVCGGVALGAVRWRVLLTAYGAQELPSWQQTAHLYLVGYFYNMYAPGGVGGDVVRGVASRHAFSEDDLEGTTGGVTIVLIERVCGVAALLTLSATAFMLWPIANIPNLQLWVALGLAASAGAIAGAALAPTVGKIVPGKAGAWLRTFPRLTSWRRFVVAIVLSFLIQSATIACGHVIISALAPTVQWTESAAVMPLVGAAAFFPLTVGGAGVREAAFAALYGTVGVAEATGYAASLAFWAAQLLVGALGGVLNFLMPIGPEPK